MEQKKRIARKILSVILTFFLSMSLFVSFSISAIYFVFFNSDTVLKAINESGYYNEVYKEFMESLENLAEKSFLPKDLFKDIDSLKYIYVDIQNQINLVFNGKKNIISQEEIQKQVLLIIEDYLENRHISRSGKLNEGINRIVSEAGQEYSRSINFPAIELIYQEKKEVQMLLMLIPVNLGIVLMCIWLLFRMYHYKHRSARFLSYAFLSNIFIYFVCWLFLYQKVKNELTGEPVYYYKFLSRYLQDSASMFQSLIIIPVIAYLLALLLIYYLKNKKE